jgi:Mitochondrial ribosomal protein mL59
MVRCAAPLESRLAFSAATAAEPEAAAAEDRESVASAPTDAPQHAYSDVADMPPEEVLARLVADASPTLENGSWRKPRLSKRQLAALQKEFRRNGCQFPELPKPFGWKPPRNPREREFKGHKYVLEKEARAKRIKANLAKMDKWIGDEKEKKRLEKLRARKGLVDWVYQPRVGKTWRAPGKKVEVRKVAAANAKEKARIASVERARQRTQ